MNQRNSIRDKVQWDPQKLAWKLNFEGDPGAAEDYCRQNGLRMNVDKTLGGHEFQVARMKAFVVACRVWNEVDGGKRRKIKGVGEELPFSTINHRFDWENDAEDSSGIEE